MQCGGGGDKGEWTIATRSWRRTRLRGLNALGQHGAGIQARLAVQNSEQLARVGHKEVGYPLRHGIQPAAAP
jgi:hypothetical protein